MATHGHSGYTLGCRCATCKKEHARYNREYKLSHPDTGEDKSRRHAYYLANRKRIRGRNREWYLSHKRLAKGYGKKSYNLHKETVKVRSRTYYRENIEKIRGQIREYFKTESGKLSKKITGLNRRKKSGRCSAVSLQARWDMFGGLCWVCKSPATETDHVIPLSRNGTNWPANLRPICSPCNLKKGNKPYQSIVKKSDGA